jgi:hypothetical protein
VAATATRQPYASSNAALAVPVPLASPRLTAAPVKCSCHDDECKCKSLPTAYVRAHRTQWCRVYGILQVCRAHRTDLFAISHRERRRKKRNTLPVTALCPDVLGAQTCRHPTSRHRPVATLPTPRPCLNTPVATSYIERRSVRSPVVTT